MWGIIEGFYGRPWSWEQRISVCSALRDAGMDTYVYAPKDDPLHRADWRDPYGEEFLAGLDTLCGAGGLSVGFAVSPGLSIDPDDDSDRQALLAKYRSVVEVGVSAVGVLFDDIVPAEGLGRVHGELTAWVRDQLDADVGVFMTPLHYTGTVGVPYLNDLCSTLPAEVPVAWTGPAVVNDRITSSAARRWSEAMGGRLPLLWDNTPVNDAVMSDTLPMSPLMGRDADLREHLSGYLANPMVQSSASVPSLLSAAAWLRGEDPVRAFESALDEDARLLAESVAPRALSRTCDSALAGDPDALEELVGFFGRACECGDAGFGEEVSPWVASVRAEAEVAQLALGVLRAETPEVASACALVLLMAWPPLLRSSPRVFGGRGGVRPVLAQDRSGGWVPGADCRVAPASIVDRLVEAAFEAL